MEKIKHHSLNYDLLNGANYEDLHTVKRLMVTLTALERGMLKGDTVAAAVYYDLETAIYFPRLLTAKQLEVVELICLHHMQQDAIAEYLSLSRQTIQDRFGGAVRKIQKLLLSGNLFPKSVKTTCGVGLEAYCKYERDKS